MHIKNIQIIKACIKGITDLKFYVDYSIKYSKFLKLNHFH